MVVVELFDIESPIDNIIGSLMVQAEHIVFLAPNRKKFQVHAQRYQKILQGRGLEITFEFHTFSKNDADAVAEIFDEMIQTYPDCAFDLSGGEDITLVAAGMIAERYAGHKISMYRINPNNRVITPIYGELPPLRPEPLMLTVPELIMLHGGSIVYRSIEHPEGTIIWDFNEEFTQDFHIMWELSLQNLSEWNRLMTLFGILAYCENQSSAANTYTVKRTEFREQMEKWTHLRHMPQRLIEKLLHVQLLKEFKRDQDFLHVSFKNEQVKECLCKAGTIWELKIYREVCQLRNQKGETHYTDCMTGVVIDWDGDIQDEADTRNEIDVIAIRGLTPAFISCKNGYFAQDELYKLAEVSRRFGGKYVRKALFASQKHSTAAFRDRADEMRIMLSESNNSLDIQKRLRGLVP